MVLSDQRAGRRAGDGADCLILGEGATARAVPQQGKGFDVLGFILVATFLGALEVVLDRGLEDDWFDSPFIVAFAVICGLAFVLMIPWELSRRNPMIDLRMVATRQFGASFTVMLATGAILLATFLTLLMQQDFGYTATWAGLALSPGGVVTMVMMFVVGRLAAKLQPKYLIVAGAVLIAISMYAMTNVYADLGFWFMARSRMLLGIGLPLIFVPIMAASYDGIPPSKTDQASALINAARNTGGSIGVSIVSNVLTHREQFHQNRLVEQVIPSSAQYQDALQQITGFFSAHGSSPLQAHDQAIQWIGAQVQAQAQASFLSYTDAFWVLMLMSLSAVPLALALRSVKLGGPAQLGQNCRMPALSATSIILPGRSRTGRQNGSAGRPAGPQQRGLSWLQMRRA
jgi:MFS transporter, DHA2 family, multidrug resistance protein